MHPLLIVLGVVLAIAVVLGLAIAWNRITEGGREDAEWAVAARRLRAGGECREVIVWDTRILRPWGPSTAVSRFVATARRDGFDWLEAAVVPFQKLSPMGVRALVTTAGGVPAAYVHCYGRGSVEAKLVVQRSATELLVALEAVPTGSPPEDLRERLEALAASVTAARATPAA